MIRARVAGLSVPCVMASPISANSFSSFSSWTQEAAAIWAKADAQLAATPNRERERETMSFSHPLMPNGRTNVCIL